MESGREIKHEAFLSLWLSRFVFPQPYDTMGKLLFSISVLLARGAKVALAPAVLSSIYWDLSLLRQNTGKFETNERAQLTVWAPFQLIQFWIWERFPELSPNPNSIGNGEPILARWHVVKKKVDLENVELGMCFWGRPYVNGRWFVNFTGRRKIGYRLVPIWTKNWSPLLGA